MRSFESVGTFLRITRLDHIGSHIWSLFAPIHMQSWPKWNYVKLKSVRTFIKITRLAYKKLYLAIIGPNSLEKLTKHEIRSLLLAPIWFYLPLLGPQIPCLPIFSICCLHLPLFTYIWTKVALITVICSYLHLIAWFDYACQISIPTPDIYSSIVTAPMGNILEQSDNYSWRYWISKNWGIQKVLSPIQFMCLSSHW